MSTNKINRITRILRWFPGRVDSRISRLWLGSALCVVALVVFFLGVRHVPVFLIGYFFIFVTMHEKEILETYPSRVDKTFGFEFIRAIIGLSKKHPIRNILSPRRLPSRQAFVAIIVSILIIILFDVPIKIFPVVVNNFIYGSIFLLLHKEIFSAYHKLKKLSSFRIGMERYFESWPPFVVFLIVALLWCAILFYDTEGDGSFYGISLFDPKESYTHMSPQALMHVHLPILGHYVLLFVSIKALISRKK